MKPSLNDPATSNQQLATGLFASRVFPRPNDASNSRDTSGPVSGPSHCPQHQTNFTREQRVYEDTLNDPGRRADIRLRHGNGPGRQRGDSGYKQRLDSGQQLVQRGPGLSIAEPDHRQHFQHDGHDGLHVEHQHLRSDGDGFDVGGDAGSIADRHQLHDRQHRHAVDGHHHEPQRGGSGPEHDGPEHGVTELDSDRQHHQPAGRDRHDRNERNTCDRRQLH